MFVCFVGFFSRHEVLLSGKQVDPLRVLQLLYKGRFAILASLAVMLSNFYPTTTQARTTLVFLDFCNLQLQTGLKQLAH